MKRAALFLVVLFLACNSEPPLPVSEPGEKLYDIRGVIEARNPADNSVRLRHEAVEGFMAAMTMDFRLRGADVASLPADGKRIEAKLHVTDRAFWITDARPIP